MAGEITFTPIETDYSDANRDWFLALLARPGAWTRMILVALLFAGLGAFLSHIDGRREEMVVTALGFALLGSLLILLIYLAAYLSFPRRTRRLYRQDKAHQRERTYRWSTEALSIVTANGRTTYPWRDFHRWRDGRRAMLLFLNDQTFFYLPRALIGDAAVDEIRSLAATAGVPRL